MVQNHVITTYNISCANLTEFCFIDLKWLKFMYEMYQNRSRNVAVLKCICCSLV
jgi:hypothetical protein